MNVFCFSSSCRNGIPTSCLSDTLPKEGDSRMALAVGFEIDELCVKQNRLDLGRAGIVPNPKRMATEQGAYYAENIYLIDELNMAEQ